MNTIVREMSPAGEIELTDAQLGAVYGACEKAFKVRQRCHFLGLAYNRLLCLDGQGKHQTRLKHAVGQLFVLL